MGMKSVTIYTDGACRGNPGPGAWAALLRFAEVEKLISGAEHATTNNRMELMAPIEALKKLKQPCQITLYTDSKYVLLGITQWLDNWKRRNWRTAGNKSVKNQDLWQVLDALALQHTISWHWVKGHSGHPENELVDKEANRALDKLLGLTNE